MYHNVLPVASEKLTVSTENLEKQLQYLHANNYTTLFFRDLDSIAVLPKRSIMLTFDDGYKNNLEYLVPLLKKYNSKAGIYINSGFCDTQSKMSFEDMRNIDHNHLEIALHGHSHINYKESSLKKIEEDLQSNIRTLENQNVKFIKVLAYPYGKYKKNDTYFFDILRKLKIKYALRIGNKINFFPTKKPYELCRIGIENNDSIIKFRLKLIFGKLKL